MKAQPTPNASLSHSAQTVQQGDYWQFGQHSRRDDARIVSTTTTQWQGRDVACDISTEKQLIINNLQLTTKSTKPEMPYPGGGMIAFSFPYTPYPINPAIRAVSWDSIVAKQEESASQLELVMDSLNQSPYIANNLLTILYDLEEVDAPETQLYYYHSDHLGSSSWITNTSGQATQHLAYLPFGESFVNQRLAGAPARYTFSAKEKDSETGYSYFGARYYESGLSVWLSVDPLADKYPSLSSYVYCANNPVILVDPDGRDIWEFDQDGNFIQRIENKEFDQFRVVTTDKEGNRRVEESEKFEYNKTILAHAELQPNEATEFKQDLFIISGDDKAKQVFEFLADHTPIEWGHAMVENPQNEINIILTSHSSKNVNLTALGGFNIREFNHNHPNRTFYPSSKDIDFFKSHPNAKMHIYVSTGDKKGYNEFNEDGYMSKYTIPEVKCTPR